MQDALIKQVTEMTRRQFRSFGSGDYTLNPISIALKDSAPVFAAGVDIETVVRFVVDAYYAARYTDVEIGR